jgi:hypothetical protein
VGGLADRGVYIIIEDMDAMIRDRWFFWAVSLIVIVGFSLWGYIQYTILELDGEMGEIAAAEVIHSQR